MHGEHMSRGHDQAPPQVRRAPRTRLGSWHDVAMEPDRAHLTAFYQRYIQRCNEHRFAELGEFVDQDVEVNGARVGLQAYAAGLMTVVQAVPDFHWDLQHLLVDGQWLSTRLFDAGTSPAGESITLQEFAIYRLAAGRIAAVWGDLEKTRFAAG